MTETPFFFHNREDRKLFGILHSPGMAEKKMDGKIAVVYCHPLFEEKLHSHRIMVQFARFAASRGIHVFRFDYRGDGESDGLFEQATVSSRIEDILQAVDTVRDEVDAKNIFLLGLRMGGTLAILAAERTEKVSGVIAWSPVILPGKYNYNILRSNLSVQMVLHKKILFNREQLIEKIKNGETVNVDGYELSDPYWAECSRIDLAGDTHILKKPLLFVEISPSLRLGKESQHFLDGQNQKQLTRKIVKEQKFWLQLKTIYPSCIELFSITTDWVNIICTDSG